MQKVSNITDDVNLMARELRNTLIGDGAAQVAKALDIAQQASDESAGKRPEAADLLFDKLRPAQLAASRRWPN